MILSFLGGAMVGTAVALIACLSIMQANDAHWRDEVLRERALAGKRCQNCGGDCTEYQLPTGECQRCWVARWEREYKEELGL